MAHPKAWWAGVAAYMAWVGVMSVIPTDTRLPEGHLDKVAHFIVYLILAGLLAVGLRGRAGTARWRLGAWAWASVYGALLEGVQLFLPWRSGDWLDLAVNAAGAAAGAWGVRWRMTGAGAGAGR